MKNLDPALPDSCPSPSPEVIAVRGRRVAVCQSPYLDSHGEEDPDMRRGRPLYLDRACYAALSELWACQALDFDSHVLHNSRNDLPTL